MTWLRRFLALSAVAVLVAACGSSSNKSSTGSTSGSGGSPATTAALSGSSGSAGSSGSVGNGKRQPGWPSTLTMGEVGQENSTALETSLAPVAKLMKDQLGITLKVVTGTSYASMIEAQQSGKAQLVTYGPFSYYIAKDLQHLNISIAGIPINAPNTDGTYYSEAVVNPKKNPGINAIKDVKGKKVCFSDPSSTSGYLYPSYGLLQVGINPSKGVTPVFAGTDQATAVQAGKGSCQVGFTNTDDLPLAEQAGTVKASDVKVIWKSSPIPGSPTAISDSLPPSLVSAVDNLFVKEANSPYLVAHGYCNSVAQCTKLTGNWGYAAGSDSTFSQIAQICQLTKSPSCKPS